MAGEFGDHGTHGSSATAGGAVEKLSPVAGLQVCTAQNKIALLDTVLRARVTT